MRVGWRRHRAALLVATLPSSAVTSDVRLAAREPTSARTCPHHKIPDSAWLRACEG